MIKLFSQTLLFVVVLLLSTACVVRQSGPWERSQDRVSTIQNSATPLLNTVPPPCNVYYGHNATRSKTIEEAIAAYQAGNYDAAKAEFCALSEKNDKDGIIAQIMLGSMYETGKGFVKDYDKAMVWYLKAATQGNPIAQSSLGRLYSQGHGFSNDYSADAFHWYLKAASQGDSNAQVAIGGMYENGVAVSKDYGEAMRWYRRAAEQNNSTAEVAIAGMYLTGESVIQDYAEATRWARKAAEQGNAAGQYVLGTAYYYGWGVPIDYVLAHMWANLAAAQGADEAAKLREAVEQKMTPDQIFEAQRLAREWSPSKKNTVASSKTPMQSEGAPSLATSTQLLQKKELQIVGTGSGIVFGRIGYVLTNHHVIDDCSEVRVGTTVNGSFAAKIVATTTRDDLAVLRARKLKSTSIAKFKMTPSVRQGQAVAVYGYPLLGVLASDGNVTSGNVTALSGLSDDSRYYQISAPVQPGNSGGPLLDMSGAVIGVVVAKLDALKFAEVTQDIPQNVNFAIKASIAINFLESRGIPYDVSSDMNNKSVAGVTDLARKFTVQVACYK